jgi:hypothetical protein
MLQDAFGLLHEVVHFSIVELILAGRGQVAKSARLIAARLRGQVANDVLRHPANVTVFIATDIRRRVLKVDRLILLTEVGFENDVLAHACLGIFCLCDYSLALKIFNFSLSRVPADRI